MNLRQFLGGLLLVFVGRATSITLMRSNVLKLEVPSHLEPGVEIYHLNNSARNGYRYLSHSTDTSSPSQISDSRFFLANGQTLTTHQAIDLTSDSNITLSVLEDTPEGTSKVLLPLELHVRTCSRPLKIKAKIKENQPFGSPVEVLKPINQNLEGFEVHHPGFDINESGQLVSRQVFDREKVPQYNVQLFEQNTKRVKAILDIEIEDVNDNLPVFNLTSTRLMWKIRPTEAIKYAVIGKVSAYDPDLNEQVVYGLDHSDPCCIVVPQTGEVMLVDPQSLPSQLTILAKEMSFPSRQSKITAFVDIIDEDDIIDDEITDDADLEPHSRPKRRATRAVRPTKRTEFTEADGQVEGKIVFQLEKESQHETFKIRDENPWVTVEPNGAVRVKKRWDYEELGREKTIDFWVIITNAGAAGKTLIFI